MAAFPRHATTAISERERERAAESSPSFCKLFAGVAAAAAAHSTRVTTAAAVSGWGNKRSASSRPSGPRRWRTREFDRSFVGGGAVHGTRRAGTWRHTPRALPPAAAAKRTQKLKSPNLRRGKDVFNPPQRALIGSTPSDIEIPSETIMEPATVCH